MEVKSNLIYYSAILLFAFYGCISVHDGVDSSKAMQETLFGIQCKIMEHGTIGILRKTVQMLSWFVLLSA